MLKKLICAAVAFLIMLPTPICGFAYSEGETKTVLVTYSGIAETNAQVSFMIIKSGGSFSDLRADDIQNVEIVDADANGNYTYSVVLKDAELSPSGEILNYKLNSNIKTLDINSGVISEAVLVKIDGETAAFNTSPIAEDNGVVFVPIAETFSKLKTELTYDAETKTYTGKGNNGDIEIVVGKNTAEVDWVDIEMPAASKTVNGVDMIPAYIIEDALKTDAPIYNAGARTLSLKTPQKSGDLPEEFDISEVVKSLPEGTVLLSNSEFQSNIRKGSGAEYVTVQKSGGVLRLTTRKNTYGEFPQYKSGIQLPSWVYRDFDKGETGLISFEARALQTEDESGSANINVMYQRTSDWNKAMSEQISIPGNSKWQTYYLPVYSGINDMKADKSPHVMLQIGGRPMCIEIRNFSFVNYKTEVPISTLKPAIEQPYKGMEEDALWRKEAYRRIEKYRKNDINIKVVDESGNPIPNAKITADMKENEFMLGVSLCSNEVLNLDTSSKSGEIYDNLITNDFNTGVCGLEMKAAYMRQDDGKTGIDMANEFLSRGKRFRGHTILWDGSGLLPAEKPENLSYDELYDQVLKRARLMAYAFKGKISQWDVLNEPTRSNYMSSRFNSTKLYSDVFKEVRRIDPSAKLYVNETGIEGLAKKGKTDEIPVLLSIVKNLKNDGAPIDGIGIQAHCTNYLYPQGFYHQLDRCAAAVDEIAVTEYDFQNQNMDYADEHLRDTLLATFSHPKSTAFVVWGVQDTMHWRNSAPFYDSDWNVKKDTLDVWEKMVKSEFETHESAETDSSGSAVIRGFRGDYDIKCSVLGASCSASFRLVKDGTNEIKFVVSGGGISAQVSNSPEAKTPLIEFENTIEAQRAYETENSANYKIVYFDSEFKGENGIENTNVLNGTETDSEGYLNGNEWASSAGIFGIAASGGSEGVVLKCADKTADLRHRVSLKNRAKNTDVVASLSFSALNAQGNGELSADLALEGEETYNCGSLSYANGVYSFETVSGEKFTLGKNERYTIRAAFVYENGGYVLRCSIYDKNGEAVFTEENSAETYADVSDINTLKLNISASGSLEEEVFEIYGVRVSGEKDGEIVEYKNTETSEAVLSDSLRNFSLSNTVYMGKTPQTNSAENIPRGKWGLYAASEQTDAFGFNDYGHYLYARRTAPNGENVLARNFAPVSEGSVLTLNYDMYINCTAQYYNSYGKAALMLGSGDMGTKSTVSLFEYDQYNGFYISVFGDNNNIVHYTKNDWNWVNLNVNVQFVPNADGKYDANVCITNAYGFKYEKTVENVLTAQEAQKLNTLYIVSQTTASESTSNSRYGSDICGFKNITVSRTTAPFLKNENGETVYNGNAENFEIGYNNITGRMKDLILIKALYKDGKLVGAETKPFTLEEGENRMLFEAGKIPNADSLKVFLLNDMQTITPLKETDIIKIEK